MKYNLHFYHRDYGPMIIREVFQEYDNIPLLFSVHTKNGMKFLATAMDENEFLLVRLTDSLRSAIIANTVDLYSAFRHNSSKCWHYKMSELGNVSEFEELDLSVIPDDYLPAPGSLLIDYDEPFIDERFSSIQQQVKERNCDIISYHITHKDGLNSIPVPLFVRISENVNQTYRDLIYSTRMKRAASIAAAEDSYDVFDLSMLPLKAGSVEINFATNHIDDLLGSSNYSDILSKFIDIIDCDDPTLDAFKGVSYEILERMRLFTRLMAKNEYIAEVGIITSDGLKYNKVFKPTDMKRKSETLRVAKKSIVKPIEKEGHFYAGNLKSRHFNFVEFGTNNVISGRVSDNVPSIQLSETDLYIAEFDEETIYNPLDEDKILTIHYTLTSVNAKDLLGDLLKE